MLLPMLLPMLVDAPPDARQCSSRWLSLLIRVAIVNAREKSRHLCFDIIVVVMHVQINLLVFLWTGVDNFIAIFFGHDTDLVFGQVRLELFGLLNPTGTERHASILVKFLCETRLHRSLMIWYLLVLWIVFELGFSDYEGSRHA